MHVFSVLAYGGFAILRTRGLENVGQTAVLESMGTTILCTVIFRSACSTLALCPYASECVHMCSENCEQVWGMNNHLINEKCIHENPKSVCVCVSHVSLQEEDG